MEKAKKDVGQRIRRIRHNLVNSSKKDGDEDKRIVICLEQRNQKTLNAISQYRKNVSATIRTGLREENVDKRRKKLDEWALCQELREGAGELESVHSTCLHKVMLKISHAMQTIADEKVKHDLMIEKRVLDDLAPFQDFEKNYSKSRERLSNAYTDVDIARKALEKADSPTQQLQDTLDSSHHVLENQKDNTITDIYTFMSKEQEVAKVFAAMLEEQLEFHCMAMRTIEMVLPEIRRDIDNARPRPVFGIDLTEHLRHSGTRIAVVLEKCCEILRSTGFSEKGLFRVSGNNTKIRRMKAAFDAGQIDCEERAYQLDPHSVCSVLKSYLRELPDPLLTNRLHVAWLDASKMEEENRLQAIEQAIGQLPPAHRDNLTYLIHFLDEMLKYQDVTAMSAGNLAIVFGPNLLGGEIEGNNAVGTRIVETLLKNANRLFGCPSNSDGTYSVNEMTSSSASLRSLNVDTNSLNRRSVNYDNLSLNRSIRLDAGQSPANYAYSPRQRPKERAPPPPTSKPIDLLTGDEWTPNQTTEATRHLRDDRLHDFADNVAMDNYMAQRISEDSDDSFNEYSDEPITRHTTDRKPLRPPPPTLRHGVEQNNRPMSYNMAVGVEPPAPAPRRQTGLVIENPLASQNSIRRPTIVHENFVGSADNANRTVVAIETPLPRPKPPLPAKPKPNESSRL